MPPAADISQYSATIAQVANVDNLGDLHKLEGRTHRTLPLTLGIRNELLKVATIDKRKAASSEARRARAERGPTQGAQRVESRAGTTDACNR
jgi:hypothetical protein